MPVHPAEGMDRHGDGYPRGREVLTTRSLMDRRRQRRKLPQELEWLEEQMARAVGPHPLELYLNQPVSKEP